MLSFFREIFSSRELILQLTSRNLRARYQQSMLGWTWAILLPAAQAAILSIVFTFFVPIDTDGVPYVVFCYVAMVPWTFLAASLPDMANSLVENMGLVTKIYFPRQALPIAAMLARLADFCIGAAVCFLLVAIFGLPVKPELFLLLPAVALTQILLVTGIGLLCAAGNVFFRDVRSLLVLGIQLWLYASPVIYSLATVPERFTPFYRLNPMVGIIESYRNILIRGEMPGMSLAVSVGVALVFLLASIMIFRRLESRFADIV
jgi:ABC-type polysaccharide/polyol phosphate export permease